MAKLNCPKCKVRSDIGKVAAGQPATCPACGYSVTVPGTPIATATPRADADSAQVQPPAPPPAQKQAVPAYPGAYFVFFSVVFFVVGVLSGLDAIYTPDSTLGKRFLEDNAYGATANAVEHIARHLPASASTWVVAGLLCLLIDSVNRLRYQVVRLRVG